LVTTNNLRPVVPPFLSYLDLTAVAGGANLTQLPADVFGAQPGANGSALRAAYFANATSREVLDQAFTPTVPRTESTVTPPDANIAAAVREQLQILGIYARALTEDERLARLRLIAKFIAIPGKPRPAESDYQVADARVEDRAVQEVLRSASAAGLLGGESEKQLDAVAAALKSAFEAYTTFNSSDRPLDQLIIEFRQWLLESEMSEAKVVVAYAHALSQALRQIELLGLTRQELEVCKSQIYGSVLRSRLNVDPEFFQRLVESLAAPATMAQQAPAKDQPPAASPQPVASTGAGQP
jgi:hypothetical protein